MGTQNDGGPAFPGREEDGQGGYDQHVGMSLRDWFAGQAFAGIVREFGGIDREDGSQVFRVKLCVDAAYLMADHMLAARKEPTK